MKRITIIVSFFIILIALGFIVFRQIDREKLTLPPSQNATTISDTPTNPPNKLDHVVIISMENKSFKEIKDSPNAPYLNSLIHQYTLLSNYFAVAHPSLPNYIALIGGDTFGITSDCTDCFIASTNVIDQIESSHKTWKAYMESMPSSCFVGNDDLYAQKHNPFIYFDDIRNNQTRCKNIVPYTTLQADLQSTQSTPNFIWISPNLCNDMHNCSVTQGDTWLSQQVPMILNSPAFTKQQSLLVITWDEGEDSGTNQVMTILAGSVVKPGFISQTSYSHYSLLHTIEMFWNLPPLTTRVQNSTVIKDAFISL